MGGLIPEVKVEYKGKNISDFINPYCINISFIDKPDKEADEITIVLDDKDGLWGGKWYPAKGDQIRLHIGYQGQKLRDCGLFSIDEPVFDGPPDKATLKGISSDIKGTAKEKTTTKHKNITLRQLAEKIAKKHGYTVQGKIKDVRINNVPQIRKSDLELLSEVAAKYGHAIKITDGKIIFYDKFALADKSIKFSFSKKDIFRYSITDKSLGVHQACEVSHYDHKKKKKITHKEKHPSLSHGTTRKIHRKVENRQQAKEMAKSGLINSLKEAEGSIDKEGDPFLYAGVNIQLKEDFNKLAGTYQAGEVNHSIDPQGQSYNMSIQISKSIASGKK